jgi:AcrR family transcriptional regulator
MNNKFFDLPEEKRVRIINGGVACFARLGYKKASTQDIAAEAGISKALLFHYFGSKKELFRYIYEFCHGRVTSCLEAFEYSDGEDVFSMMLRANRIKLELFRDYPDLYRFVYQAYFEKDPDVQEIVKRLSRVQIARTMSDVTAFMDKTRLRDCLSPEQALQIILWVSEGFLQRRLEQGGDDPVSLMAGFVEWMDILKICLYRN